MAESILPVRFAALLTPEPLSWARLCEASTGPALLIDPPTAPERAQLDAVWWPLLECEEALTSAEMNTIAWPAVPAAALVELIGVGLRLDVAVVTFAWFAEPARPFVEAFFEARLVEGLRLHALGVESDPLAPARWALAANLVAMPAWREMNRRGQARSASYAAAALAWTAQLRRQGFGGPQRETLADRAATYLESVTARRFRKLTWRHRDELAGQVAETVDGKLHAVDAFTALIAALEPGPDHEVPLAIARDLLDKVGRPHNAYLRRRFTVRFVAEDRDEDEGQDEGLLGVPAPAHDEQKARARAAAAAEARKTLMYLLASSPEAQRLWAAHQAGAKTQAELGQALGGNERTIRNWLRRLRKRHGQ